MEYRLTIVVPVYNEQENLARVEEVFNTYFTIAKAPSKVLFVNDGSSDKSLEMITAICDQNAHFEYISFSKNYGLSAAIKAGFDYTDTELVGYIDSDLQTAPEDFNILLEPVSYTHLTLPTKA